MASDEKRCTFALSGKHSEGVATQASAHKSGERSKYQINTKTKQGYEYFLQTLSEQLGEFRKQGQVVCTPDGPYYKDAWHYRDRVDADIEREYDGNGNLVKDLDAGILRIEYNSLNLPSMIRFSDYSRHVYAYDATGRKLRAEYHTPIMVVAEPQVPDMGEEMPEQEEVLMEEQQEEWNEEEWGEEWEMEEETEEPQPQPNEPLVPSPIGNVPPQPTGNGDEEIILPVIPGNEPVIDEVPCEVTTIDYCGDFIYVNGKLKRMLFPGGYVTFTNDDINQPEYHFYLTDHQGNVRVVANQNGEVEQVNHYYPYGGLMGESTNSDHQPYKYNGKELDRHHGLDWYDYGARWYNGISWMTPDPLAEKYYNISPYVYCDNNPMRYIDPTGKIKREYFNHDDKTDNNGNGIADIVPLIANYKNFQDGGNTVLNLFAHGSPNGFNYKGHIIEGSHAVDFLYNMIQNDTEMKQAFKQNKDNGFTIILHMCSTATFAKQISSDPRFKNITIIAPNGELEVKYTKSTSRQIKRTSDLKNEKFSYNIQSPNNKNLNGVWKAYVNGKNVANYKPESKPGSKDFDYEKNRPQKMVDGRSY